MALLRVMKKQVDFMLLAKQVAHSSKTIGRVLNSVTMPLLSRGYRLIRFLEIIRINPRNEGGFK